MPTQADQLSATRLGSHGPRRPPAVDPGAVERTLAGIPLRDDQKDAVRAYFAGLADCEKVRVVELPTGAGKTRVGVAVAACLMDAGCTVLWACKSRRLLRQAADTLATHFPELAPRVHWLGRRRRPLPVPAGGLVFATLQAWHRRRDCLPAPLDPAAGLAVVWDEVHWAFHQSVGRAFRGAYRGRVPVLGLSATPPHSADAEVVYRRPAEDYFGTVLATPVFERVETGVSWAPVVRNDEFTPDSLQVLAANDHRNAVIVDTLVGLLSAGRAKSVLVFAANVRHAQELERRLSERGVPARAVHSRQKPREQAEAEASFRAGRVDVLVNVDQLTEGFDHPPVGAVLLTRPTRSRRRWVQMVGRGARKAPGKDTFLVVDFADNVARFGSGAVRAETAYPMLARPATPRPCRAIAEHVAPPADPRFENYAVPGATAVPIALGQTFGVEIELTSPGGVPRAGPEWRVTARTIIEHLAGRVSAPVHPEPLTGKGGPLTAWRVTHDASCGWEVVSPVLVDAAGFDELGRACGAIAGLVGGCRDLRVNHRTGLHVTLATRLDTDEKVRGFVRLAQRVEPGLFTLVAPSRLYRYDPAAATYARRPGNPYCLPLRGLGDPAALRPWQFAAGGDRYRSVNLTKSLGDVPLLEVRMHGGTHEFGKIALWLSLWMQLFNAARHGPAGPAQPGPVFPGRNSKIGVAQAAREDIVALLTAEGVPLSPGFVRLVRARRRQLRPAWEKVMPHRVGRWARAGWYD